ncbi:permease component of ribose/xylose/arabinose/galactoside ABC-type transporter [Burkholderia sp. Ch1-1]|uniref:Permease component of ribose/xylose/arabinose/galactoside ABC-type transporter n=1 Tax=Paraburkholderia dioscoreae TaxID=2604047 RepID=A0A5Q4YWB3_9BURK|nr:MULTISPECIES: ABC transporter permease [Paraburkholderia]EIF34339.1 permease component of ribose/xylose/arabinose/galactoside ABC-type transporter [Burkholderia sp. Ch1-1]MDR8395206.1 ABC transporter permease [Paraburkholderia sp. USG1]VVD33275.1 Permease component of ribose/xylose/arabinose/galactoside ABC-type transporter [Paraburkholderia dioscoreae]
MNTKSLSPDTGDSMLSRGRRASFSEAMLPLLIVLIAVVAGIVQPRFFTADNMLNLARQAVPLMILSLGQAIAILRGGLDLSLASVMSLAGVAGVLTMQHMGIGPGLAVMIATGIVTGLVSGFIIAWFRTTPLVVTLGMLSVAQAIALILSGGVPIYDVPADYAQAVGFGSAFGVPVMVWIAVVLTAAMAVLLRYTVFGRYVYAMGSNQSAAAKSGVNVRFYTMLVYAVSGFCASVGAVVLTAWVSSAQPIAAPNLTLQSLAAVVLGGVALTGGAGGVRQVFLGVLVLTLLSNVMNMVGVSAYYQTLVVGIVIILAVILDRYRRKEQD